MGVASALCPLAQRKKYDSERERKRSLTDGSTERSSSSARPPWLGAEAYRELGTGREKRNRGLGKMDDGLEVLRVDPIEVRWPDEGDRRGWLVSTEKAHKLERGRRRARSRTARQLGVVEEAASELVRRCSPLTCCRQEPSPRGLARFSAPPFPGQSTAASVWS